MTDAEIYNSQTDEWTVLPSMPDRFPVPYSYVHNGHTFFMGGGNTGEKENVYYLSLRGMDEGKVPTAWGKLDDKIVGLQAFPKLVLID